jgi:hypothetical protein
MGTNFGHTGNQIEKRCSRLRSKHSVAAHRFRMHPKKKCSKVEIVENLTLYSALCKPAVRDLTQRPRPTRVTSGLPHSKARLRRKENVTAGTRWKLNFHLYVQLVNSVVKCTVCSSIVSIASGGTTSIRDHLQTKKHRNALLLKSQSGCTANYFRKLEPSKA